MKSPNLILITKKVGIMHNDTILVKQKGKRGLANRLWQFSYFLAFAKEHNLFLINSSFYDFTDDFVGTKNNLFCSYPIFSCQAPKGWVNTLFLSIGFLRRVAKWLLRRFNYFNKYLLIKSVKKSTPLNLDIQNEYKRILQNKITFIDGWHIRCNDTLNIHKATVTNFFRPVKSHKKNIRNLLKPLKHEFDLVIGIHMRRTDYKFVYPMLYFSFKQYAEFLNKIANYFEENKIAFLLCSDDEIEKKYFSRHPCFYSTDHAIEDMFALSKCNYIFGVSSTYSLWASFYGSVPIFLINDYDFTIKEHDFFICNGL